MLTHLLLALTDNVLGNSGVFTESYSRVFASGNYNNQPPDIINTTDRNNPNVNSMFSLGLEDSNILNSNVVDNEINLLFCENLCNLNPNCQGIFNYDVEPTEIRNYTQICNTLTNLGEEMTMDSFFSSESYAKVINYLPNVESTNIEVIILNINIYDYEMFPYNTTVFIDLNNDGLLDDNEPFVNQVVYDYEFVEFNDLEPGVYHIRQIIHNNTCAQAYPGIEGNFFFQANGIQDHFADRVIYWKSSVHSHRLKGGHISSTGVVHYENPSLNYILGNNSTTFLSFCPDETITISFVDDVIHNTMGDDIIFNLYRDNASYSSNTWGNVFISFDNASWTYVGNVSYEDNVIDLTEYNYQGHANFLRIEFMGTNHMDFLNISSIELGKYTRYYQPFAITIDSSSNWFGVFFNDCSGSRICGDFCNLNIFDNAEYFSCLYGCDSFDELRYCDCHSTQEKDELFSEYYNDYNFSTSFCYQGCIYDMETYLGANYIAFPGRQGNSKFLMNFNYTNTTFLNRTSQGGYLSQVFDACEASSKCRGITVGEEGFSMYSDLYNRVDDPNTVFIVKFGPITSPTTTQTSTQTTSQTSTQTTSQTSTQTTSQTSTQTTSQTSTQTTSQTSTQTTSQTTTQTSSPTTTLTTFIINEPVTGMSSATLTGILVSIFIVLAIIAAYLFMINRKQKKLNAIEPQLQSGHVAFDNPVYEANVGEAGEYSDIPVSSDTSCYRDVLANDYAEPDYLDVMPDTGSSNSYDLVNDESDL